MTHAPTPWHLEDRGGDYYVYSQRLTPLGDNLLMCDESYYPSAPDRDTALFIVRAVNAHAALVAALESVVALIHEGGDEQLLPGDVAQDCRAALDLAKA